MCGSGAYYMQVVTNKADDTDDTKTVLQLCTHLAEPR